MTAPSEPTLSTSESNRFGLRIARWSPSSADEIVGLDPVLVDRYDVVILRRPTAWADTWASVLRFDGHRAIHADTLVYWRWSDRGESLEVSGERVVEHTTDHGLDELVRDVFESYQNHYLSNPLLDRRAALDGYVEWAINTAKDVGGYVTIDDGVGPIGFGVVDWHDATPDVRLAGMRPRARGQGKYATLMTAMMSVARDAGVPELLISTQVQNVAVQRAWASLGWRPVESFDTTHLVRAELLAEREWEPSRHES